MIAAIGPEDHDHILALNNAHAIELSWLEAPDLKAMAAEAFYARRIGRLEAFMIAFDETANYQSPNYLWFRARHAHFVYVDRIAVSAHARGRGLARTLYEDLFTVARTAGHERICCEVNSEPPNPASDALHDALGFATAGLALLSGSGKTVRYLEKRL